MYHRLFAALAPLLARAIADQTFPGAAVGVSRRQGAIRQDSLFCFGRQRFGPSRAVAFRTCYDLASLTKPLATTLCIFSLIKAGSLSLTTQANEILKDHRLDNLNGVTILDLLNHHSGLAPYHEFFHELSTIHDQHLRDELLASISRLSVDKPEDRRQRYSDIGFILLGMICEQVSGLPLDLYAQKYLSLPLDLQDRIFFNRRGRHREADYAPTEERGLSGESLTGQVHDENAALLGGVAGHAGLFGDIGGVLELVVFILEAVSRGRSHPYLAAADLRRAVARREADGTWGLGFDTRSATGSSSGEYFSAASFGHLGFTGTSFWVDPERELAVVLLSNRVHPRRDNVKIKEFRPRFHDVVMRAVLG